MHQGLSEIGKKTQNKVAENTDKRSEVVEVCSIIGVSVCVQVLLLIIPPSFHFT